MATLQRFKLLATQCGVVQSPTRSPGTSPVVQLRRRKTMLRMLLSRRSPSRREQPMIQRQTLEAGLTGKYKNSGKDTASHTLKDLLVSSPETEVEEEDDYGDERRRGRTKEEVLAIAAKLSGAGLVGEPGSSGPVWAGLRKRLLRRAWRPMLPTISE